MLTTRGLTTRGRATLGNLGIRPKLLGIIAAPLVVLVALAGLVVTQAVGTATAADRVSRLTGTAGTLDAFVHALQTERSVATRVVDAGGVPTAGSAADTRALTAARRVTDARAADADTALAQAPTGEVSAAFAAAVDQARQAQRQVPALRSGMDSGEQAGSQVLASYTDVIEAQLAVIGLVADATDDTELAQSLRGYAAYTQFVEAAWVERDVVATAWERQWLRPDEYYRYVGAVWRQDDALDRFTRLAPPAQVTVVTDALSPEVTAPLVDARRHVGELLTGPSPAAARIDWAQVADRRLSAATRAEPALVDSLAAAAGDLASAARGRAALIAGGTLAGVLLLLALGGLVSRRIVDPIRGLTDAATRTAQLLPEVVARMQTPGAPPPRIEHIPVAAHDEVGRLAAAFNEVNDVALRVAGEQASLRAGIADMFVNVARRNQVLLGRQLTVIDRMEDDEQDPDRLERLFQVDHLATRMRRNAESLLVLAGVDASRRLRAPMPLTDVIRSAISEIESFERVDLTAGLDPPVQGRLAMSVAHLLAELIENATHFSNPDSRVTVTTGASTDGVIVTIGDRGLGMTDAELATANDAFGQGATERVTIGRRLGFLVVSRLAERLGAGVRLAKQPGGGTQAVVTLPTALFVPGSLAGVLPPADAGVLPPADAGTGVPARQEQATPGESVATPQESPAPVATPEPVPAPVATPEPASPPVPEPVSARRPAPPPASPTPTPTPTEVVVPAVPEDEVFTPISAPARNVLPGRHSAPPRRRWSLGRSRQPEAAAPAAAPAVPSGATPGLAQERVAHPPLVAGQSAGLGRARPPAGPPAESPAGPSLADAPAAAVGAPIPPPGPDLPTPHPGEARPAAQQGQQARPVPSGGAAGSAVPLPPRSRALLDGVVAPGMLPDPPGAPPPLGADPVVQPPAGGAPESPAVTGVPGGAPVRLPGRAGAARASSGEWEGADIMADRSALASQALSELSQLNAPSYAPAALAPGGPVLVRRVPRDGQNAPVEPTPEAGERVSSVRPAARARDPEAVRARLTDFRAGVIRGRGRGRGAVAVVGGGGRDGEPAGPNGPDGPNGSNGWSESDEPDEPDESPREWSEPMTEERG